MMGKKQAKRNARCRSHRNKYPQDQAREYAFQRQTATERQRNYYRRKGIGS